VRRGEKNKGSRGGRGAEARKSLWRRKSLLMEKPKLGLRGREEEKRGERSPRVKVTDSK